MRMLILLLLTTLILTTSWGQNTTVHNYDDYLSDISSAPNNKMVNLMENDLITFDACLSECYVRLSCYNQLDKLALLFANEGWGLFILEGYKTYDSLPKNEKKLAYGHSIKLNLIEEPSGTIITSPDPLFFKQMSSYGFIKEEDTIWTYKGWKKSNMLNVTISQLKD